MKMTTIPSQISLRKIPKKKENKPDTANIRPSTNKKFSGFAVA